VQQGGHHPGADGRGVRCAPGYGAAVGAARPRATGALTVLIKSTSTPYATTAEVLRLVAGTQRGITVHLEVADELVQAQWAKNAHSRSR